MRSDFETVVNNNNNKKAKTTRTTKNRKEEAGEKQQLKQMNGNMRLRCAQTHRTCVAYFVGSELKQ